MTVGNCPTGNPTVGFFVHLPLSPVAVGFFRTDDDSRQAVWTGNRAVGNRCEKVATIYCQGFLVGAEAKPRVLMRGSFENVLTPFEAIQSAETGCG